jgi:hypothetical protein
VEIKPMTALTVRETTPVDIPTLHRLMRDFAIHQRALARFQIAEDRLHEALFSPTPAVYSVVADVHEWNRQAVEFYDRIGSTSVSDGRLVREMTGEALIALATGNN